VYVCNTRALFSSVLRRALSTGRWPSKVLLILLSSGAILLRKFLVDFSPPCIQPTGTSYKIEHQRSRGSDMSLARTTSRYILFDDENISFDASLVMYINSTNIPPTMIINRIYETQKLLSL
jgi:hypothetical protein